MADEFAHVWAIHTERVSGRLTQIDLEVQYLGRAVRLPIHLMQAVDGQEPREPLIARELTALGEALIRIAQRPESILDHRPPDRTADRERNARGQGGPRHDG